MIGATARIILTLFLLYGVYTETGPWTALFGLLVFAAVEVQVVNVTRINKYLHGK